MAVCSSTSADKPRRPPTPPRLPLPANSTGLSFTNGGLDNGPLPNKTGPAAGDIAAFAREVARVNGFEDGQNGVTVEVHIPPVTGPFTGQAGHVEVKITTHQRRHFSRVFGPSDEIPVGARAVARGRQTTIDDAMIILDPTLKGSFQTSGGGTVTATGSASIVVNSSDPQAMIANGGGTVSATSYSLTGIPGWSTPGSGFFGGTIHSGQPPMADPLRFLPQPDPSALVRPKQEATHDRPGHGDDPLPWPLHRRDLDQRQGERFLGAGHLLHAGRIQLLGSRAA